MMIYASNWFEYWYSISTLRNRKVAINSGHAKLAVQDAKSKEIRGRETKGIPQKFVDKCSNREQSTPTQTKMNQKLANKQGKPKLTF
jgi:tRNA(Leu) C34 or U34 (ribose-2'-O)-methylase TrmL